MAWQADTPTEESTKKFLLDLVRQMQRGFISCRSINKETHVSKTEMVRDRPLVEGMTIQLDFSIFYRPQMQSS